MYATDPLLPTVVSHQRTQNSLYQENSRHDWWIDKLFPESCCFCLPFHASDPLALLAVLPTIYFFVPVYLPIYQTVEEAHRTAFVVIGAAAYGLILAFFSTFAYQRLDMVDDFQLMVRKHETRAAVAFALTALAFVCIALPPHAHATHVLVPGVAAVVSNALLWWMSMAFVWRLRHKPWPLIYKFYYMHRRHRLPILASTTNNIYSSCSSSESDSDTVYSLSSD